MTSTQAKQTEQLPPELIQEATAGLDHLEATLSDAKNTSKELVTLGGNVDTEQLYTTEIIGKNTKRTDILARFSTPELQAQTVTQIEQSGNTELQAQLAALMSGGVGFTLIGRLRKGVIDMSKHDITTAPFPEEKITEILSKAEQLGLAQITSIEQLTTIATTMGIDLGPQQPFLTFLQQDSPLSNEIRQNYLPKIANKMHASMAIFLRSYQPGEKTSTTRGSVKQLLYTKEDLQRKNPDGTRNTANIQSFAGKTLIAGGTVGLLVKGWKWLFGSKKNEEKKKGWFSRTMDSMRNMLMIGGGATVGHRLITGERRRGTDGVVDNGTPGSLVNQKEAKDYVKEFTPEQQAVYNTTAQAINEMYSTNIGLDPTGSASDTDLFGESSFEQAEKTTPGLLISVLDKRYSSVDTLTSSLTVYMEMWGKTIHESLDRAWDHAKDALLSVLGGAAGLISSSLAERIIGVNSKEQLTSILQEHPQITDKYDETLRKYLKIITYFHYKKQQLPGAIARAHLISTDASFGQLSEKQQVDKIDKLLEDNSFVTNSIEPILKQYQDAPLLSKEGKTGAIQLLTTYNILDGKLIPADQKKLEKITKEQAEMIDKDTQGDVFDAIQESLQENDQPGAKKQLIKLQNNLEAHATTQGRASWRSAYMPLLTMFDTDAQTKKQLFNRCGFDEIANIHLEKIKALTTKEALTEADIKIAQQTIDDYFSAVKELELTNIGITGIFEENGEIMIDIGNTFLQTGESLLHGIRLTFNKDLFTGNNILAGLGNSLQGLAMLGGGTASLITYPLRVAVYPLRAARNLSNLRLPPKFPKSSFGAKVLRNLGKWTVKKTATLAPKNSLIRTRGLKYTHPGLFRADLASGKLSLDEGVKIAQKYRNSTDFMLNGQRLRTEDDLLRRAFGLSDQAHIDLLKANRNAPRRSEVMQQKFVGQRYKPRQRLDNTHRDRWFDTTKLQNYTQINQHILSKPPGVQQDFFTTLLSHSKDEHLIKQLLSEPFPERLIKLFKQKNINLTECAKLLAKNGASATLPTGKTHLEILTEILEHCIKTKKITNIRVFTENLLRRRPIVTAQAKSGEEAFDRIEKGLRWDMNKTRLERGRDASKGILQAVIDKCNKIKNNPRLTKAFQSSIGEVLSKSKKALQRLTPAKMKLVQQRIQGGKIGKAPQVLKSLLGSFQGSKGVRLLGSVLGKVLIVGGLGFTAYDAYAAHQEAEAYDLANETKKNTLRQEANIKTGLLVAEGATVTAWGASALFTAATGVNAIPVAGQIASIVLTTTGAITMGVDYFYDTENELVKKQADFLQEALDIKIATKQNIVAAVAYHAGQTRSIKQTFYETFSGVYLSPLLKNKQATNRETYIKNAIQVLIGIDELETDSSLATQFVASGGIGKDGKRPKTINDRIEQRYNELTKLYGSPPLTEKDTEKNEGITLLSRRIHASRWFSGEQKNSPSREKWEQEISTDNRYALLKTQFDEHHLDLVHYRHNKTQVQGRLSLEANNEHLINNLDYFDRFMSYQNYLHHGAPTKQDQRTEEKSKFAFPQTASPIDEQTVDMQEIVGFFTNRQKKPTPAESVPVISKEKFEKERQISGTLGQQVIYRLCTELYGYRGPNILREDPSAKTGGILGFLQERTTSSGHANEFVTGIYYSPTNNMLKINKTGALKRDHQLCLATPEALNKIENIQKLAKIFDKHNIYETKNRTGEKMINTELTDRAKRIVNEELRRRSPEGKNKVNAQINNFRKKHGHKTPLPAELSCRALRAGVEIPKATVI